MIACRHIMPMLCVLTRAVWCLMRDCFEWWANHGLWRCYTCSRVWRHRSRLCWCILSDVCVSGSAGALQGVLVCCARCAGPDCRLHADAQRGRSFGCTRADQSQRARGVHVLYQVCCTILYCQRARAGQQVFRIEWCLCICRELACAWRLGARITSTIVQRVQQTVCSDAALQQATTVAQAACGRVHGMANQLRCLHISQQRPVLWCGVAIGVPMHEPCIACPAAGPDGSLSTCWLAAVTAHCGTVLCGSRLVAHGCCAWQLCQSGQLCGINVPCNDVVCVGHAVDRGCWVWLQQGRCLVPCKMGPAPVQQWAAQGGGRVCGWLMSATAHEVCVAAAMLYQHVRGLNGCRAQQQGAT